MRAWYVAGMPEPTIRPLGSFEKWTKTVGGILQYAGIGGFLSNSAAMYDAADDESREWEQFLLALFEVFGASPFSVSEIVDRLDSRKWASSLEPPPDAARIKAALPSALSEAIGRDGQFSARIGRAFSIRADRRFGKSEVHLKRGNFLTGRLQWEIVVPTER